MFQPMDDVWGYVTTPFLDVIMNDNFLDSLTDEEPVTVDSGDVKEFNVQLPIPDITSYNI